MTPQGGGRCARIATALKAAADGARVRQPDAAGSSPLSLDEAEWAVRLHVVGRAASRARRASRSPRSAASSRTSTCSRRAHSAPSPRWRQPPALPAARAPVDAMGAAAAQRRHDGAASRVTPAASEMGGLAKPDGVLAIDWQTIEQVHVAPGRADRPQPAAVPARHAGRPALPRARRPGGGGPGGMPERTPRVRWSRARWSRRPSAPSGSGARVAVASAAPAVRRSPAALPGGGRGRLRKWAASAAESAAPAAAPAAADAAPAATLAEARGASVVVRRQSAMADHTAANDTG